ncbi:MAG: hypothetical protein AABY22_29285 [Nanoarchaeota archaeon]
MDRITLDLLKEVVSTAYPRYTEDQAKRAEAMGLIGLEEAYDNILAIHKHILPGEKYKCLAKTAEEEFSKVVAARRALIPDTQGKSKK